MKTITFEYIPSLGSWKNEVKALINQAKTPKMKLVILNSLCAVKLIELLTIKSS